MKKPPDKPTILTIVKSAQPVTPNGEVDLFADRRVGDFIISLGRIYFMRKGRDLKEGQPVEIPTALTHNFVALITEQIDLDDGVQQTTAFSVAGRHHKGRILRTLLIPATQYLPMQWHVKHWGALAIVEADQATPRRLANAILILSGDIPVIVVYQHTGWRLIDDEYYYLTGSGGIGQNGLNPDIRVDLGASRLQLYELPAPIQEPRQIAGALFELMTVAGNKPAVGVALFCFIIRTVLSECVATDFSLFLSGLTGSKKSEIAALVQAFFGNFKRLTLPAGFKDTQGALELKTHRTKDAVLVVDDLKPGTSRREKDEKTAKFDYLVTGAGDQMGRSRLNPDATEKPAYYPRCGVIITGEYIPDNSASTLARLLVIEMTRDDVDESYLSFLQDRAKNGKFAAAMAAFIKWLAPRMPELKLTFEKTLQYTRDEALADRDKFANSHPRSADIYASMKAAAELYIDFAVDTGAIGKINAERHSNTIDEALKGLIRAQSQFQKDSDEVQRFVALLRSCFAAGECHVNDYQKQGPPEFHPFTWGWRSSTDSHYEAPFQSSEDQDESLGEAKQKELMFPVGRGMPIGWIRQAKIKKSKLRQLRLNERDEEIEDEANSELWLDPQATFTVIQRFANHQNDPILLPQLTLWQRVLERGLLIGFEVHKKTGKRRYDGKTPSYIAGKRPRVLRLPVTLITNEWVDDED